MSEANKWLVVFVLAAATAPACGGGSGECTPACAPAFECYYGACVPLAPDSGLDGATEGLDDGDARPLDNGDARPLDDGDARPLDDGDARPLDDGDALPLDDGDALPRDDGDARPLDDGDARPLDDGAYDDAPDVYPEGGGCTVPEDCADGNPCTQDLCDTTTGTCRHPIVPAGTLCPDGICCGAACRVGGDCCTDAECRGGCRGTAAACAEVPGDSCGGQVGCRATDSHCGGTGSVCYDLEPAGATTCESCGCASFLLSCWGEGRVNCAALPGSRCENCECYWHSDCEGVHQACDTYGDQATCDGQLDCYWSTCRLYLCT